MSQLKAFFPLIHYCIIIWLAPQVRKSCPLEITRSFSLKNGLLRVLKGKVCIRNNPPRRSYPGFSSMKRQRSVYSPTSHPTPFPGWVSSLPAFNSLVPIHSYTWSKRDNVRVPPGFFMPCNILLLLLLLLFGCLFVCLFVFRSSFGQEVWE